MMPSSKVRRTATAVLKPSGLTNASSEPFSPFIQVTLSIVAGFPFRMMVWPRFKSLTYMMFPNKVPI